MGLCDASSNTLAGVVVVGTNARGTYTAHEHGRHPLHQLRRHDRLLYARTAACNNTPPHTPLYNTTNMQDY